MAETKRGYREEQTRIMKKRGLHPVPEIAEKIGVAPSTLYRWIDDGKVDGEVVGTARYVRIKSVRKYLGSETATAMGL